MSEPLDRAPAVSLPFRDRFLLLVQREIGRLVAPIAIPAIFGILRWRRYRIAGRDAVRAEYRRIRREHRGPLLVCANHLTRIDSILVAWALGSAPWLVTHFASAPWNMPERRRYGSRFEAFLVYVLKCIPILRGGDRALIGRALDRFTWLLTRREVGLLFPEGGRSRTGRVDVENATYGVGRILGQLPGARVLCVYLRGAKQGTWSDAPTRGDTFHVELALIEPRSEATGLRAARDLSLAIVGKLAEMEARPLGGT